MAKYREFKVVMDTEKPVGETLLEIVRRMTTGNTLSREQANRIIDELRMVTHP